MWHQKNMLFRVKKLWLCRDFQNKDKKITTYYFYGKFSERKSMWHQDRISTYYFRCISVMGMQPINQHGFRIRMLLFYYVCAQTHKSIQLQI